MGTVEARQLVFHSGIDEWMNGIMWFDCLRHHRADGPEIFVWASILPIPNVVEFLPIQSIPALLFVLAVLWMCKNLNLFHSLNDLSQNTCVLSVPNSIK